MVIPKSYRQKLGWDAGMELVVEETAGTLVLKAKPALKKTKSIRELGGILNESGTKAHTLEEMDEAVDKMFENWES